MRPQLTRADICTALLELSIDRGPGRPFQIPVLNLHNCFVEKAGEETFDLFFFFYAVHGCKQMPPSLHALRYFSAPSVLWGSGNQLYSRTCMECACCLQPSDNHCSFRGERYRQQLSVNSKGSKLD